MVDDWRRPQGKECVALSLVWEARRVSEKVSLSWSKKRLRQTEVFFVILLYMAEDVSDKLHELAVTAIIVKDGKYLITHRNNPNKKFYDMWTVPGGRLELADYERFSKDTSVHWYNIVEKVLRREIQEEVGLEIENIDYLTSIAMHVGEHPSLILSFIVDYKSGNIVLQEEELDQAKWVSLEEAKEYDLIEGIYDELVMAEEHEKREKEDWQKADS